MGSIFTPSNQIKLTNVAIVRLKRAGKRFEIACYKNKVLSWRDKSEKDIDEVLQTHDIFTNVSKGQFSKSNDLQKAFSDIIKNVPDKLQKTEICKFILQKGDLQVSSEERKVRTEEIYLEIANLIATMAVDTETERAIPVSTILQAMKEDLHYAVKPNHSAKKQALDVLKSLKENCPELNIDRSNMRLALTFDNSKNLKKFINDHGAESGDGLIYRVEDTKFDRNLVEILSQPGNLSVIEEKVSFLTKGKGDVDVLELHAIDTEEIEF